MTTNQARYYENDLMTVTVQADRDCYVQLYLINAEMQVQQLFPNKWQQNNFVGAGQQVHIPGPGARFQFRMTPPFGIEIIKAVASTTQFDDLQNLNWHGKTFLNFGTMPLSDMNAKGVAVEDSPETPEISQAVVMYESRPR